MAYWAIHRHLAVITYVSYSWPLKVGGEHSRIEAATYLEARKLINESVGLWFGMHLNEKEFLPLIDKFQLKEVEL